jgi:hypothetical protein
MIDIKKTIQLKKILNKMKHNSDDDDFDNYMRELDYLRQIDKERNDVIRIRWVDKCAIALFKRALRNFRL